MFGLEEQKKNKKNEPFIFDLEKELSSRKGHQALLQKIEHLVQALKESLRAGDNKHDFDTLGILLHGYVALLKVAGRIPIKGE